MFYRWARSLPPEVVLRDRELFPVERPGGSGVEFRRIAKTLPIKLNSQRRVPGPIDHRVNDDCCVEGGANGRLDSLRGEGIDGECRLPDLDESI